MTLTFKLAENGFEINRIGTEKYDEGMRDGSTFTLKVERGKLDT